MKEIQNIKIGGIGSGGTSSGSANMTDPSLIKENKSNLTGLEALRNKMASSASDAQSSSSQANEHKQQAQQYMKRAENSPDAQSIKDFISMAKQAIEKVKQEIKAMIEAIQLLRESQQEYSVKAKGTGMPSMNLDTGLGQNNFNSSQKQQEFIL